MGFHKILLKFTKIRMDFQLTNFFGEFYMIFSLSVLFAKHDLRSLQRKLTTYFDEQHKKIKTHCKVNSCFPFLHKNESCTQS
jgi:hypothetical protein